MNDSKLTLTHRFELQKEIRQHEREEAAYAVRLSIRREVAEAVTTAQAAVIAAEELAFRTLPTPLPENAAELVAEQPIVAGRQLQLSRFEDVYATARIEAAESVAKAIVGETPEALPSTSPKQTRRTKQSGSEG